MQQASMVTSKLVVFCSFLHLTTLLEVSCDLPSKLRQFMATVSVGNQGLGDALVQ
jgi:hypothetical protein